MNRKIKLGIIGLGNIGSIHSKNIAAGKCPELELVAAADLKPARLEWVKTILPEIRTFDSAEAMLDSGLIEAVLVCVPHYYHPKYAIEALKRGLHVMCEKPAGVYTLQVREMMAEADRHPELSFGLMFNQRTNCLYRKLRELVQSGKYGRIRRTNWIITNWYRPQSYFDSGDWRATWSGEGGGVLLNQSPHQLDLWQWICGMPVKVQTQMQFGKWHDIEVEDDVTTYVEYPDGGTGVFITSTGDAHGDNRFEIQMDKARFLVENDQLTALEYEMSEPEFSVSHPDPFSTVKAHELKIETDGKNEQHCGVLNAWAGNILRGIPLVADGRDGINGLMLSNAMHLSAWLGKEISLPFDEELFYNELMKRVATSRRKENVREIVADAEGSYGGTKK